MLQFIIQYWLQVLLTLISGGLGFLAKKFWNMYKSEKQHQKTQEQRAFYQGLEDTIAKQGEISTNGDAKLQSQIDIMKQGLLTIHRKTFLDECYRLLNENHEITLDEFKVINEDYKAYKELGGNGQGATLYAMVQKKATNNIADGK